MMNREELKGAVKSMVEINQLLKARRKETKVLSDTYKDVMGKVKAHMKKEGLIFIESDGMQIHTYERTSEPSVNEDFLTSGIREYMTTDGVVTAEKLAQFLWKRKKDKVDGKKTWTTTLRDVAKAKANRVAKRAEERKSTSVSTVAKPKRQQLKRKAPDQHEFANDISEADTSQAVRVQL